jgi:hypothetical protein
MLGAFARFALHGRTPAPSVAASAWTFRLHAHYLLGTASLGASAFAGFGAVRHFRRSILRHFAAHAAFRQLSLAKTNGDDIYSTARSAGLQLSPANALLRAWLCAVGVVVIHDSFEDGHYWGVPSPERLRVVKSVLRPPRTSFQTAPIL